jgi:hypothetical protein
MEKIIQIQKKERWVYFEVGQKTLLQIIGIYTDVARAFHKLIKINEVILEAEVIAISDMGLHSGSQKILAR